MWVKKRLITKKLPVFCERGTGLTPLLCVCFLRLSSLVTGGQGELGHDANEPEERHKQWVDPAASPVADDVNQDPREELSRITLIRHCNSVIVSIWPRHPTPPLSRSLPCICWRSKSWNYHWWHQSSFRSLWENIVSVLFLNKIDISAGLWLTLNNAECIFACRDCRVVKDMATGKSKGYGFVTFFNKWVRVPAFPSWSYSKPPRWALDVVMYYVVSTWFVTQTHFPRATRMQRMPSSRWADSGWEGGRSGPTGLRGNLSLNLQMKVCSTALQSWIITMPFFPLKCIPVLKLSDTLCFNACMFILFSFTY